MKQISNLQSHMEDYFQALFQKDRPLRPKVDGLQLPMLGEGQVDWLERPFEKDEVKRETWMLDGDKAPGPDGFTLAFYKACWEVIKEDLMLVVKDFHEKCFLDIGNNATYIALIPKREGVDQLSNFWSVSLVGSTYKIISKCLALHLKEVLPSIVSKE